MKYIPFLPIILVTFILTLASCGGDTTTTNPHPFTETPNTTTSTTTENSNNVTTNTTNNTNIINNLPDETTPEPTPQITVGFLIDAPVIGVNYECDGILATTKAQGRLSCETPPITFFLGGMKIGQVSDFTTDNIYYPQDLLGLPRTDFSNEVIKLASLLQSSDEDGFILREIFIPENISERYDSSLNFSETSIEDLAIIGGIELFSDEDVLAHLSLWMPVPTPTPATPTF